MKKLLALVLSLVMALSLIPTVWGTELDDVFAQLWEAGADNRTADGVSQWSGARRRL